ncbi:MAG: NAD-dependent epimerase/dehydratase family protein [Alphaproteobacteria bacterium]|nr:NAD-dependent epimerase/dehydratase family protein [Alphaproteobacteria bacterium]
MTETEKPLVIVTGASGNIGKALCRSLEGDYLVVGMDIRQVEGVDASIECDLTWEESVRNAFAQVRSHFGGTVAAVVHLAAYFDFTGEEHPLYETVNVEGTRRLLKALQDFTVERFVYSSTMLVHEPAAPGEVITEDSPVKPGWAYPRSKARAEDVVRNEHGVISYTILRLAGLYDDETAVPTLSQQIARIYERDFKSLLYAGDLEAGQAFIHQDDMIGLFRCVVERRGDLPPNDIMLAGGGEVMGYQAMQDRIGGLIFGEEWGTINLPRPVAKAGAWAEDRGEPVIPDAIDKGERPFIKPFMIDLASDHYALDISRAKTQLGWMPRHRIADDLAVLIANLKKDPAAWYAKNKITPPDWVAGAAEKDARPDEMRTHFEREYRRRHQQFLWAHFLNMGMGLWLLVAPATLSYESPFMVWSDIAAGVLLLIFSALSLSWRLSLARWAAGAVGLWLLSAPLVFWAPTAEAYLNGTLVGMIVMGLAIMTRPTPGVSPLAAETGPTVPPGWSFSPSGWFQRAPIIMLAFLGFFISRYMCAYQLGHIDAVWEPFFAGAKDDPQNGTEEIITSSVSEAWPVPDAGLGAMTYALEILTGFIGGTARWRTIPWLVMLFGVMIVPLGVVSIFFIIIQPIMLGTWCSLCLIAAAAMLIQIPYSVDELVATSEFLYRRKKKGRSVLRTFFLGDTDDDNPEQDRKEKEKEDNFEQSPLAIVKNMWSGGVTVPWNLMLCVPIGVWLMFTRLTIGAEGLMADTDHLIGSLVLTVVVTATAESVRAVRFLLVPLGAALMVVPFTTEVTAESMASSLICGALLIALSFRKGKIGNSYGVWERFIV